MSKWNAMTYEGKDTIMEVVHSQAKQMFAMAEKPEAWHAPTACEGWEVRDVVAHIVDTIEGYFRAFDAAHGKTEDKPAHGLAVMSKMVDEGATALREIPQAELMERLRTDFYKLRDEILMPLGPDEWTGFIVTHPYMGPVPAFFYAAGQLMDFGVHSWDIRQGTSRCHGLDGDAADLLVPFMLMTWQYTVKPGVVDEPFTVGVRIGGHNGGDYRMSVTKDGMTYEQGEIESLPAYIEFDSGSMVLTAFGRGNFGTIRGDFELAEKFLNLFFRI